MGWIFLLKKKGSLKRVKKKSGEGEGGEEGKKGDLLENWKMMWEDLEAPQMNKRGCF